MIAVELGGTAWALCFAAGMLSGLISVWMFRRFADEKKMHVVFNRILAGLLEFRLFADEPLLIFRAQRSLLRANVQLLRQALLPALIVLLPLGLLLAGCEALFERAPLKPGEDAVLTVKYNGLFEERLPSVELRAPLGIAVETLPVRIARDREISWRLRVNRPASGDIEVVSNGQATGKAVCARLGLHWLSERRVKTAEFLLHPLEWPLPGGAISSIAISYPPATVWGVSWLVWFFFGSLFGAAALLLAGGRQAARLVLAGCLAGSLLVTPALRADTVSPLFARGYTVIPEPRHVTLGATDFRFGAEWRLEAGKGIKPDSSALQSLSEELKARFQLALRATSPASGPAVELAIEAGSVRPGASRDRDRRSIADQAYKIVLNPARVRILANAPAGLFYGVQTLVQLVRARNGGFSLPEGEIVDWPDLGQRQIYWDDAHHLERLPALEEAVRQASFFKINGFVIKLEGHFQFRDAAAAVEPQALSPEEFQQLTNYGLRRHVQVIPYLDAPGHLVFLLKHPKYAKFRAFPDSNYELCTTNPDALRLLYGMYDDLLAANRGVKYFYLSTDEAYYVGMADNAQCNEFAAAKEAGSRGKVLAQFVDKAASYLRERGRTVVFWGEYPLKVQDIQSLPKFVINGETDGEKFDSAYRANGIRQMIYQATEGEEPLFPHYFLLPASRRMHPLEDFERVPAALASISSDLTRSPADLMGLIVAGWGDIGLHPDTFWLGYATIAAAGWHRWTAGAQEAMSAFYPSFYGAAVEGMNRIYQLLSYQAQTWNDTWERVDSHARKPIWGNSEEIFKTPRPAHDQSIPLPPTPDDDLRISSDWSHQNADRLRVAEDAQPGNDELLGLLNNNFHLVTLHRGDLEVFVAITKLCRQNLDLLTGFGRIDEALTEAAQEAKNGSASKAVAAIDRALAEARTIRTERNLVFHDAVDTWYESWLPRVPDANGRRFLHAVDDVKDHLPDRTIDMTYLIYRELQLPMNDWYERTQAARNRFAARRNLPAKTVPLLWKELE